MIFKTKIVLTIVCSFYDNVQHYFLNKLCFDFLSPESYNFYSCSFYNNAITNTIRRVILQHGRSLKLESARQLAKKSNKNQNNFGFFKSLFQKSRLFSTTMLRLSKLGPSKLHLMCKHIF